jgi:hypothetical protein
MHEDVGRYVGAATSALVQTEQLETTCDREKENRRREEQSNVAVYQADRFE